MAKFRNIPEDQQNELEEQMNVESELIDSDDLWPPDFHSDDDLGYDEFLIDQEQDAVFPILNF